MKKKDLEKKLADNGYSLKRHGSKHDMWGRGGVLIPVPRHREINERLAKKILKDAGIN